MTVSTINGTLKATNTTGIHDRAILAYRTTLPASFSVSIEYRGALESFDLQAADFSNRYIDFKTETNDDQWRTIVMRRSNGTITGTVNGVPIEVKVADGASGSMRGCFVLKLLQNRSVEIRNFSMTSH